MNRYLTKIAAVREKEEFVSDKARAAGRGLLTAAGGLLVGTRVGGPAVGLAAGAVGAYQGIKASLKNQRRENDLHNIKLEGATQRREIHEARMKKMAEEHQGLKDAVNTGVIAGLGGLGTLAASRLLKPSASKWATFGMGVGTGLIADYAGIKANKMINAKIDGMSKQAANALSRNFNSINRGMTSEGFDRSGNAGKAMQGFRANAPKSSFMSKVFRGPAPAVSPAQSAAEHKAFSNVSSSELVKTVGSNVGTDRLATTTIQQRLQAHKAKLGLPGPGGKDSINNALALRNAKAKGKLDLGLGAGGGSNANSNAVSKVMGDAKAGFNSHLSVSKGIASVSSTRPAAASKGVLSGLASKAKALLATPLGRKVGIGAGVVGGGMLAHKAYSALKSNGNADQGYAHNLSYGYHNSL